MIPSASAGWRGDSPAGRPTCKKAEMPLPRLETRRRVRRVRVCGLSGARDECTSPQSSRTSSSCDWGGRTEPQGRGNGISSTGQGGPEREGHPVAILATGRPRKTTGLFDGIDPILTAGVHRLRKASSRWTRGRSGTLDDLGREPSSATGGRQPTLLAFHRAGARGLRRFTWRSSADLRQADGSSRPDFRHTALTGRNS